MHHSVSMYFNQAISNMEDNPVMHRKWVETQAKQPKAICVPYYEHKTVLWLQTLLFHFSDITGRDEHA